MVETVRDRVRLWVELRGLRPVARDIGVSASGLKKFARGLSRRPYGPTWRCLLAWCARHPPVDSVVDDTRADAVRMLTRDFAPEVRAQVAAAIIRAVDEAAAPVAELPAVPAKAAPHGRYGRRSPAGPVGGVARGRVTRPLRAMKR